VAIYTVWFLFCSLCSEEEWSNRQGHNYGPFPDQATSFELEKEIPGLSAEILADSGTDYRYRIVIPKSQWAEVVSEIALEQTWSNFKNEAARFAREDGDSTGFVHALHDIWGTMYELQQNEK
jgi:hypothetical protein